MKNKCTVVFAGRRDNYEVGKAFREAGWDVALVTDFAGGTGLGRVPMPQRWRHQLKQRAADLEGIKLILPPDVLLEWLWRRLRRRPASVWSAERLGRAAARVASDRGGMLVAYSTYGYEAFPACPSHVKRLLFQMHPHADACVQIIEQLSGRRRGRDRNIEWEFQLPEASYQHYRTEWQKAQGIVAASSYTRATLVSAGADPERIAVVPYGADLPQSVTSAPPPAGPVRLLFVGSFVRRKGAMELAEAATRLRSPGLEVHACGRGLAEPEVLQAFQTAGVVVHWNASDEALKRLRAECDAFVFPSLLEGFAHVILEAMGAGLPVISTERTCAPDLLVEGRHGWVVQAGNVAALEQRMRWCRENREALLAMRPGVRARAGEFTWSKFRAGVVAAAERLVGLGLKDGG